MSYAPRRGGARFNSQIHDNGTFHHADFQRRAMATVGPSGENTNAAFRRNNGYSTGNNMYAHPYGSRAQTGQSYVMSNPAVDPIAALAQSFQGMAMQPQSFAAQAKSAVMSNTAASYNAANYNAAAYNAMPSSIYEAGGPYVYPAGYATNAAPQTANMYSSHAPQYMPQTGYQGYQTQEHSPLSQQWTPTMGVTGEVPTLITPRRDSISSNGNDQPATPSYASVHGYGQGGVAVHRSPSAIWTHSTPSPNSMIGPYGMPTVKQPEQSDVSPRIKLLVTSEPSIPRAIPAPSSPLKPLDRALENQRGETNVYIRGLLPETTDEMLEAWGTRFGDIKSSKSIIDMNTGLCKGFGFVKYHNYEDAEHCIRGFHYLGYEVSFARESFYSKLKTFADACNTNLYVSNLPKSMNEHELAQLFDPHKVCSSRILRDRNGHGRGVGFARFESRDACEEVIKTFNNFTITSAGEEMQMQIRYADTQEQKSLKQQTQAARQFRSAEYEYATQAWRQGRLPFAGTPINHDVARGNEFEQYLGTAAHQPIQGKRWAQSALRQAPGRSPLGGMPYTGTSQPPLVQNDVGISSEAEQTQSPTESGTEAKPVLTSPATVQAHSPIDSAAASEQD